METLLQDLRTGLRMLVKNPGFTAVAVITLALGIGANSAIFSVVNAVLLRPYTYKDPERLVLINHNYPKINLKASVSVYGYSHYRDNAQSFEDIAAVTGWPVNLTGEGEPERLNGMMVTASLFSTLGADAARGRVVMPGEDRPDGNRVVVLSHAFWQRRFGGDPNILDRTITLSGQSYSVVGVMPPEFQFGREVGQIIDLWGPIGFTPEQLTPTRLTNEFLSVVARLKPNVAVQQAQAEMDTIAASLREQYMPGMDNSGWGLLIQPFHELVVGEIRPALMVLMGVVGLVLLIACVNVANLLLARAAVRRKEIAIRSALGAGRARIVRQLLTESALLALLGGAVGLLVGYWGVKALVAINESRIPRSHEITLDYRVVGFSLLISLVTGVLFGLLPAFHAARTDLNQTLKEGGRSGTGGVRYGIRGVLVVLEVAIALVVLANAGLFLKSFARLQQVDPGFQPQNVISMQVSLPDFKYREPTQRDAFFRQALEQIRALPGVESAGAVSILPMSGSNTSGSFRIEGREVAQGEVLPHGDRWFATSDYFKAMQVPLIRGRYFDDRDTVDAPGVAILDETMARKYWPDEDPIGRRISFEGTPDNRRWREIVGIVGHVKHKGLEGESRVQYYVPFSQRPASNMFLVARTRTEPGNSAGAIRGVIRSIDQDLPVFRVSTMEQLVAESTSQRRFSILLLGVFAAVALLLAAVGLYGVMGYSVNQRTQEIGVRMALGAGRKEVLRLVAGQGMALTGIGLFIGLGVALAVTHLVAGLLFGVSAYDPVVFAAIPLVLAGVALVACYLPARRASRVDPITALRYE